MAGVDEVGRGCLAGPVFAAAVILPRGFVHRHLQDSKLVKAAHRVELAELLRSHAEVIWAIGTAEVSEIDSVNILQATFLAMARAVAALSQKPQHCLIDGNRIPKTLRPATSIVGGDSRCPSIAAASILAKTARDAFMTELDGVHPHYGFGRHKGYGTKDHISALTLHGPSPVHRLSFGPVRLAASARTV